uniref:Uncharacterized protein n=2 Tax=Nonomuraea gerenzanensis TaxID=93944 RepID=A0A1M4BKW4_9ACTN|nr:hypothetical protein BN4615_P10971 [Nonomuraea gerenzanensis]
MSAENDRHKQLIAALLARIQGLEQQVARYTPPPQVRAEMAVPSGSMRPVLAAVDGRTLVIVAPPGGFADPDEAYGRIVHHYADEALP